MDEIFSTWFNLFKSRVNDLDTYHEWLIFQKKGLSRGCARGSQVFINTKRHVDEYLKTLPDEIQVMYELL